MQSLLRGVEDDETIASIYPVPCDLILSMLEGMNFSNMDLDLATRKLVYLFSRTIIHSTFVSFKKVPFNQNRNHCCSSHTNREFLRRFTVFFSQNNNNRSLFPTVSSVESFVRNMIWTCNELSYSQPEDKAHRKSVWVIL
eukprot:TRINITY_DN4791_c0_g1_i1.p1 TRINITY_DN4791_c0_g1~~TRINITY_DN4791_c0_g1_i1.p1  ORF type:complete len:140 (+),score=10.48 TRINITY_DN4791_c0_g1_i1:352-771(+)